MKTLGTLFALGSLVLGLGTPAFATTTLKIATAAPEGSSWMYEMRKGAHAIKLRTQGRVEIKFYPGAVMGNDTAVLLKIKLGQLQGGAFSSNALSPIDRDVALLGNPFLFRNQEEVDYVRSKFDPLVRQGLATHGLVAAGLAGGGFTYLFSTKPIRNHDELRATKVWAPAGDRIDQLAFEAGGVQPIVLPLSDVYTALQTGLVDTVANTPSGVIAFQWHTKVKFMVNLPLTYVLGVLAVDKKSLDALGTEERLAVVEEMQKAFDHIDQIGRNDNQAARKVLVQQGIQLVEPSAGEITFWQDVGEVAAKGMGPDEGVSPQIAAAVRSALAEFRGAAVRH